MVQSVPKEVKMKMKISKVTPEPVEILENIEGETKAEAFKRLANFRLAKTVKRIRQIGNLSSKVKYEYTPEQAEILMEVLNLELEKLEQLFQSSSSIDELPEI